MAVYMSEKRCGIKFHEQESLCMTATRGISN